MRTFLQTTEFRTIFALFEWDHFNDGIFNVQCSIHYSNCIKSIAFNAATHSNGLNTQQICLSEINI